MGMKCTTVSTDPLIRLYNGDSIKEMRTFRHRYDLALTDPPYGIGMRFTNVGDNNPRKPHKKKDWNNSIPPPRYFNRLFNCSENQIIFGWNYFNKFSDWPGRVIWHKLPTSKRYSHCEIAYCSYHKLTKYFKFQWAGNCQNGYINHRGIDDIDRGLEKRIHPTQKPVGIYKQLLRNYAKPGQTILDTHGGSMSIAIACYDLGHPLDLYELDGDYYQAGVKRVRQHIAQGQLFRPDQKQESGEQLSI